MTVPGVAVILPAYNEGERIVATVGAALTLPHVRMVVVVDDGSADETASVARKAGATVLRHERNRGKAAAMETGARHITQMGMLLLFLDADLKETAAEAAKLIDPIVRDEADMTIATFPKLPGGGGMGFVVRLARWGIQTTTGRTMEAPLSGQRCVRRGVLDAALPLAPGFGVETALTIDVLKAGYRILEIPTQMAHRVTGTDLRSHLHRARQWRDVAKALLPRLLKGRSVR
ncbi:MAG: glycosyltransferase family 2 protein [Akkermansiaceae bacterium]|nr:glycosyltransferase family 2 protein [Armatimonadota bacterium]